MLLIRCNDFNGNKDVLIPVRKIKRIDRHFNDDRADIITCDDGQQYEVTGISDKLFIGSFECEGADYIYFLQECDNPQRFRCV